MRRCVRRERYRLTRQVFDAVDALLANHAVGAPRPIDHEECVGAESFVLKLGVVFGPHVGGGEHDVDIVGSERRGAFGPVVYDFETDLEALLVIDRTARGIKTSVGDQAGGAPHPDIDADPHIVAIGVGCRRDWQHQGLGSVDSSARCRIGT